MARRLLAALGLRGSRKGDGVCARASRSGRGLSVSSGLVCSVSVDRSVEIWWTDSWKVLFDNGNIIKWKE